MTSSQKQWVALIAVAIIALLAGLFIAHQSAPKAGGVSNYDTLGLSGLQVGAGCNSSFGTCPGTTIARINTGQCYFAPSTATIAASSTVGIDCQANPSVGATGQLALAGVTLGDNVLIELSTTTGQVLSGNGKLLIKGASASTTAGFITVQLENATGATFTWPVTGTASGTASYIVTR